MWRSLAQSVGGFGVAPVSRACSGATITSGSRGRARVGYPIGRNEPILTGSRTFRVAFAFATLRA